MPHILRPIGFLIAMVAINVLLGCGGEKSEEAATNDKKSQVKPASARILGHWKGKVSIGEETPKKPAKENPAEGAFLFSFLKGGTGKSGGISPSGTILEDMNWEVASEEKNRVTLVIDDGGSKSAKLQLTLQDDDTIVGKMIAPEGALGKKEIDIILKRIDKLPEETGKSFDAPNLGQVSGRVLLAGKPLPNATVMFLSEHGRPSIGKTNEDGTYEMLYSRDRPGAEVGTYTVSISTASDDEPDNITPEKVPAKYNVNSVLKVDVKPGINTFDFDLDSRGEINDPNVGVGSSNDPKN